MLTIEKRDVCRRVKVGDLFDEMGFHSDADSTDESGDTLTSCDWDVEVLGEGGYHRIEGLRWTKPEKIVALHHRTLRHGVLDDAQPLLCASEHLVKNDHGDWVFVKDLRPNDLVVGLREHRCVTEISDQCRVERLCDIQVADVHCYYADDILSHNSHWLTMLGANALRIGKNVVHYTFELSEAKTGIRYDSNLCDIESNDVVDNKESLREKYVQMRSEMGKLKIKFWPSGSATVHMVRMHIEKLALKGFVPDLVLIDYADIMKSSRSYDSLRHELKLVYTELRGLAEELQTPIWTASQSNKEGSQADIVDLNNMSEAYGKAFVADVVLSLSRKSYEKASGWGRMYIAKNRAGRDGLVYPIRIDTARSMFYIAGPTDSVENAVQEGQAETKKKLLMKLRELDQEGITKKGE